MPAGGDRRRGDGRLAPEVGRQGGTLTVPEHHDDCNFDFNNRTIAAFERRREALKKANRWLSSRSSRP